MSPTPSPGNVYSAEAFERLAHGVVAIARHWLETDASDPQTTSLTPSEALERILTPLPVEGSSEEDVLARLSDPYAQEAQRLIHPRYIGHQVAPPIPVAAAVDPLISIMNNGMAVWEMSPTATPLEHTVLSWFAGRLGWGDTPALANGWGGSFVSGGAAGNLTALAAARARLWPDAWKEGIGARRGAIIVSAAAHYCFERAAGLLGLGSDAVLSVPTEDGRMIPGAAGEAIARARSDGRDVLALVATAGTTPIGAIDDLAALAGVARENDVWFHVDAAHGGAFLLSERLRPMLAGLELADSLALDLHKMMFQPISTAMVLVRERARLVAAFAQDAPYLFQEGQAEERVALDLGGLTLQCSKRADALRAWATLQLLGARGVAALQERVVDLAADAARALDARPTFECLHRPQTNILCFRHVPAALQGDEGALDRHNDVVRERLRRDRFAYLTGTTLEGRRVLRCTFINPLTELSHFEQVLDRLDALAPEPIR